MTRFLQFNGHSGPEQATRGVFMGGRTYESEQSDSASSTTAPIVPVPTQSAEHTLDSFPSCCIPAISQLEKAVVPRCDTGVFWYLDVR